MRRLNVTYAVKFNWAHRCRGTVFQAESNRSGPRRKAKPWYHAAAQAVKRFAQPLADDPERERFVSNMKREMSTI
jgi:hypothetical protein